MLTQCPKCETIYRIDAADLGAAQGFVECGDCGEQFNALSRLADEPSFPSGSTTIPADVEGVAPSSQNTDLRSPSVPAFVLLDDEQANAQIEAEAVDEPPGTAVDPEPVATPGLEQAALFEATPERVEDEETVFELSPEAALEQDTFFEVAPTAADAAEQDTVLEIAPDAATTTAGAIDLASIPPAAPTLSESEHAILFTDPSAEFADDDEEADEQDDIDIEDVPEILKEEFAALNKPRRTPMRWLWMLLAVFLLLVLSLQIAWVFRDRVIATQPQALPLYRQICERLGCQVESAAQADRIELLARDVRDHPQYRDSLLVNATLVSRSDSATLFPVIQLGLFDQTGEVIGIRRFDPSEYLDKSIDLGGGMPPNRSVYIVLEVAGVGTRAVGFEFSFL